MSIDIHKDTLKKTIKCEKEFQCLSSENRYICPVTECISNSVHFITFHNKSFCAYQYKFGDSDVCCCPTRKEIYNIYKI